MEQQALRAVTAYVGLGSNLGDREQLLKEAVDRLNRLPRTAVEACSAIYETEPVGLTEQPAFLNMACRVVTALPAAELFRGMLRIEQELGRVRTIRWGPRTIDLDLLAYDGLNKEHTSLLHLPHPRILERAFVLIPLLSIITTQGSDQALREWASDGLDTLEEKDGVALWKPINWHSESGHFAN